MQVVCEQCGLRVMVTSDLPSRCDNCGDQHWRSVDEPQKSYTLNAYDRRFLKAVRIAAEEESS
jgi:uncharacterized Zn finger protein